MDRRVKEQLELWRNELINLSGSNRLLFFKHTKTSTLEVSEPNAAGILAGLGSPARGGWEFFLPPEPAEPGEDAPTKLRRSTELLTSKPDEKSLAACLRALDRRATQEYMDKGLWVLYLGVGILEWEDTEAKKTGDAPLLLVPVTLHRSSPREPYRLRRAEEDPVLNPALAVKLDTEFGLQLPSLDDVEDLDPQTLFAKVQTVVDAAGWTVHDRTVLATFSFHKEVMYRDLLANAELVAENPLVQALALGPKAETSFDFDPVPEEDLDEKTPIEQSETVLDADASQRQCIAAACAGHSFVVDGPPGTGKSQTITNLIAELLEEQKKVLFVSEKAAALEVVHSRLEAAGLGPYVLELHSHKATRKEVAQDLGRALAQHPKAPASLEDDSVSRFVDRRRKLSGYAQAMNVVRKPLGRSLHDVLGRIGQLRALPQAPIPATIGEDFSADALRSTMDLAGTLGRSWGPVERGDDFLWRGLQDVGADMRQRQALDRQLADLAAAIDSLEAACGAASAESGLRSVTSRAEAGTLLQLLEHAGERPQIPGAWLTKGGLDTVRTAAERITVIVEEHHRLAIALVERCGERWTDLNESVLTQLRDAAAQLSGLAVPVTLEEGSTAATLASAHELLTASPTTLLSVVHGASPLLTGLGVTVDLSPHDLRDLATLGGLGDAPHLPEGDWLSPAGRSRAERAVKAVAPVLEQYAALRDELAGVFSPAVLELDLDGLSARFAAASGGFAKLRGSYREDKKALAQASPLQRFDRRMIELLPRAVEWKLTSKQLDVAGRDYGATLGSYWNGADTDLAAAAAAVDIAGQMLDLAGSKVSGETVASIFGKPGGFGGDFIVASKDTRDRLEGWLDASTEALPTVFAELPRLPWTDVAGWCEQAAGPVSALHRAVADMSDLAGRELDMGTTVELLRSRVRLDDLGQKLAEAADADRALLGSIYGGLDTDLASLSLAITWADEFLAIAGRPLSARAASQVLSAEMDPVSVQQSVARWDKAVDSLVANFAADRAAEVAADLNGSFLDARDLVAGLASSTPDIEEWATFNRSRVALEEAGFEPVVEFCVEERTAGSDIADIVERSMLEAWADAVIGANRAQFEPLSPAERDQLSAEFRQLDEELIRLARGRIIASCNKMRPKTRLGAAGVIEREANKKRKHMPVRRLLEESAPVAQQLKPCFMMSPLTVSQFVPPTMTFDAVIFDEASQVRPSDAINCVYRGAQLIVAGDQKQLPPTSFFEKVSLDEDDEYEEEQFEEFESILDLCKGTGTFRSIPLRWHYRSHHEDLITYSNYAFYDGMLVTFPGAVHDAKDLGVGLIRVKGTYRRGGPRDNPIEAAKVAERVLFHTRNHPECSLGVVAFSEAQAAAIEIEVDKLRLKHKDLDRSLTDDRLNGFFVKNLENVQGDERDIIIFSVGYGPDENGRFTLQMGPLTKRGGHRRLNVAISRARRRVEVVSSVTAGDFGETASEGVAHLKRYLDFLDRGLPALALELTETDRDVESPFEEDVLRTVRGWGYDVVPQVGAAEYRVDLAVRNPNHPGRYALGIECDGVMYHSSKVARDRDRLREGVLRNLGWELHRIWGTGWYRERAREEERLRQAIEEAIDGKRAIAAPSPAVVTPEVEFEDVVLDEAPPWSVTYAVTVLGRPRVGLEMHDPIALPHLKRMIKEVVRTEAPVASEFTLRRLREAWGVGRAGSRIREAFDKAVKDLTNANEIVVDDDNFFWADWAELAAVRVPDPDDPSTRRTIDEVSGYELKLAIQKLVEQAGSVTWDELSVAIARLFGWARRGSDIRTALDLVSDALIEDGALRWTGERLERPS